MFFPYIKKNCIAIKFNNNDFKWQNRCRKSWYCLRAFSNTAIIICYTLFVKVTRFKVEHDLTPKARKRKDLFVFHLSYNNCCVVTKACRVLREVLRNSEQQATGPLNRSLSRFATTMRLSMSPLRVVLVSVQYLH